jgi:hypothetical protein
VLILLSICCAGGGIIFLLRTGMQSIYCTGTHTTFLLSLQIYLDFIDDAFAGLQDKRLAADAAKKKFTVAK